MQPSKNNAYLIVVKIMLKCNIFTCLGSSCHKSPGDDGWSNKCNLDKIIALYWERFGKSSKEKVQRWSRGRSFLEIELLLQYLKADKLQNSAVSEMLIKKIEIQEIFKNLLTPLFKVELCQFIHQKYWIFKKIFPKNAQKSANVSFHFGFEAWAFTFA